MMFKSASKITIAALFGLLTFSQLASAQHQSKEDAMFLHSIQDDINTLPEIGKYNIKDRLNL
jgi:hypothetical protein